MKPTKVISVSVVFPFPHGEIERNWLENNLMVTVATEEYEHIISCSLSFAFSDLNDPMWRLGVPLKIVRFTWLILHNRILTWDSLMKKGFIGHGRCSLCQLEVKYCLHPFYIFPFSEEIWKHVISLLGL